MCVGCANELDGLDLGDKRLNERGKNIIELLGADCQASVNAACGTWAETNGTYRFFNNPNVSHSKILEPHFEATMRRIAEQPVALVVQDTTELDFTKHPTKDAGCLNAEGRLGLYDHSQLAVTPEGMPLGVVGSKLFSRTPESLGKSADRSGLPIEEKESFRWIEGLWRASDVAEQCPDTQIVCVGDRESDFYDFLLEANEHPNHADAVDFVIRAKEERRVSPPDGRGGVGYQGVRDVVGAGVVVGRQTLELERTPKRAARIAEIEIRARRVVVEPPSSRSWLPEVEYNVVLVEEVVVDGVDDPVCWVLITSLPIDSPDDVFRVIDYYKARWTIEVYFRVLKTGCRVEEIQLETNARLENCLAFYKIIAWRTLYLVFLNRECPELPCDAVFANCEWMSVWRIVTKKEVPEQAPPLSEFVPLLASLGGYNNRPSEPSPGPQAIWIGIRRMIDFGIAWLTFGPNLQNR